MFCPKCGKEIIKGAKFCSKCGTPIVLPTEDKKSLSDVQKTRFSAWIIIAAILILIIVVVGAYYLLFYDNDTRDGLEIATSYATSESLDEEVNDKKQENVVMEEPAVIENEAGEAEIESVEEVVPSYAEYEESSIAEDDVLQELDVESKVLEIRKIYNTIQNDCSNYNITEHNWGTLYDGGQYRKAVVKAGYNDKEYERWFFYENNQLIFSFYYSESEEQRLYFYENRLFRWKNNDVTHDKEYDAPGWYEWENLVLSESAEVNGNQ